MVSIFFSLASFYVTVVVEELRSGYSAIYDFAPKETTQTVEFNVYNLSRAHQLTAANFLIRCADQNKSCFEPFQQSNNNKSDYVFLEHRPPNLGREIDSVHSTPAEINVCLTVIANSWTAIQFRPKEGINTHLVALYDPLSKWCSPKDKAEENVLLLHPYDLHAIVTRYYFEIISFTIAALALTIILLASILAYKSLTSNKGRLN